MGQTTAHLFLVLTLVGCVSVQIKPSSFYSASDVTFKAPDSPYQNLQSPDVDHAWYNPESQTSISYLSECGPDQASLQQIQNSLIRHVSEYQLISNQSLRFLGVPARHLVLIGKVEDMPTYYEVRIFKKGECNYILNYIGPVKLDEQDRQQFERFLQNFRVP